MDLAHQYSLLILRNPNLSRFLGVPQGSFIKHGYLISQHIPHGALMPYYCIAVLVAIWH